MQPSGAAKTSRNPFRALVSGSNSNNTSSASSSSAGPPNSSAVPPVPVKGALQQDVPGAERDVQESSSSSDSSRSPSPAQRSAPPSQGGGPSRSDDLREILRAETPPPYTPTPDVYQGETTVEFGPRRPFEAAPAPGQTPWQQRPRWQAPQPTGQFAGYPGAGRRPPVGNHLNVPPPPQHPLQRASTTGRPTSAPNFARSEFARDFYTAGADSGGLMGGSSSQYAPPPSQPPNGASLYAAPPGPPPANGERSVSPAATGTSQAENDGRPTNTPVPGHPLMNNGRVLVYPLGHECKKCRNTGYKHLDPSHPCSKCWAKYARPFTGPLQYAPWSSADTATNNFQRPLPSLPHSPTGHRSAHSTSSIPPPTHPNLSRSATTSRVGGYPGAAYPQSTPQPSIIPVAGGAVPIPPWLGPLQDLSPFSGSSSQYARTPPPGAAVYTAGDPRIGGHLCWRCGGRGTTSFMIFDQETCGVCGGIGRVFR